MTVTGRSALHGRHTLQNRKFFGTDPRVRTFDGIEFGIRG